MINFPTPFFDELLYSVLARYHHSSGNESGKKTLRDLFSSSNVAAITAYSGHLYRLYTLIPGKAIPISYILEHHTLIPYYRPFIPKYRFEKILHNLVHTNCQSIYMWMGLPPSGVKMPRFLRYCIQCVRTDRLKSGLAYWHRSHQLAGVSVCPEHQCYLLESPILYAQKEKKHMFIPLEAILSASFPASLQGIDKEINIAQKAVDLLNSNYDSLNLNAIREQYFDKLQSLGFLTPGGKIKFRELIPRFNSFYGTTLLEEFGCVVDKRSEDTWLHKILRKPRHSAHPLRHLLVQYFLNLDLKSIAVNNQKHNTTAFGHGPWPCLNKASAHFQEKVIKSVRVTRCSSTAKPVGTFQCSCGFIYSRRGPDQTETDIYRVGRIKQLGAEWMKKLNELSLNPALSLREKARRLGVDPGTVKKYLNYSESAKDCSSTNRSIRHKLKRQRQNYSDKRVPYQRVDWKRRDEILAQNIEKTATTLKSNYKRRISRSIILQKLHCTTMIHTKQEKLPLSRAKLERVVETTEQYHERKRLMG
ncbi:TnsD family Tn7-like transposition protein [Paenibacillus xylanilyticus]|uniref:Transposon Tn7 transposition protein TnsD C-termianl domain-containing protein n=1 Tax=Paenibacillus xylanilyticus TaxID=248903 RepID=A0A7Y6EU43_9BACL|nr:TnsD family Tn7-like transposition protein [Paenibacillus xylanilyticus]NUU74304.1 hypothetical protein [Paenibacillus xylanilyticus]